MKTTLFALAISACLLNVATVNAQDKKTKPTPQQADQMQMQKQDRPLVNGTVNDKTITPVNGQQMNGNAAQFDEDQRTTEKISKEADQQTMSPAQNQTPNPDVPQSSTENRPDRDKAIKKEEKRNAAADAPKPR
jgi:hypothetical protein